MSIQPITAPRRLLLGAAGLVLSGLVVAGGAQPASAATRAYPFESFDSTPVGCTGARINGIEQSTGVRYYYRGHRLSFPTTVLPFNKLGVVELTAKAKPGYTISQTRGQLLAPASCFTDVTVGGFSRFEAVNSWCKGDAKPTLSQAFTTDDLDGAKLRWRVVRSANHHVVASGTTSLGLGVQEVDFALPAGLPLGRYVLTVRNTASSKKLFPYSMKAEQLRCMQPATATGHDVTFVVPKHGPDARIEIYDGEPQAPTSSVEVPAGHSYTYHAAYDFVFYEAYAAGDHVGLLGFGSLDLS